MKLFTLIAGLILTAFSVEAQSGSWKIKLNNKLTLATSLEDEAANSRNVKSADWKKKGYLEISFTENEPDTWRRTFLFFDEQDNQLLTKDSVTYSKIPIATLRNLFKGKKEISIYTIVSPLDPSIAIRMRRVHLCTLKLP